MKFASVLVAAGLAAMTSAAPTFAGLPVFANKLSSLANAVSAGCDVSAMQQPKPATTPLPSPAGKLVMIALGKGTQNYTCPTPNNPTATPTAVGALATLYNYSCVAANANEQERNYIDTAAEKMEAKNPLLAMLPVVGKHYFSDATTPTFDLTAYGVTHFKKNASSPAPTTQTNAVPWLYLKQAANENTDMLEVYRLDTNNGAAPAACGDNTGAFQVDYTAEYWFYTKP